LAVCDQVIAVCLDTLNARVEIALQQIDMKQAVISWLQARDTDFTL